MYYVMQRVIEDRNSLGLVVKNGDKIQTLELPLKELKLLAQDINDILELYF